MASEEGDSRALRRGVKGKGEGTKYGDNKLNTLIGNLIRINGELIPNSSHFAKFYTNESDIESRYRVPKSRSAKWISHNYIEKVGSNKKDESDIESRYRVPKSRSAKWISHNYIKETMRPSFSPSPRTRRAEMEEVSIPLIPLVIIPIQKRVTMRPGFSPSPRTRRAEMEEDFPEREDGGAATEEY
ncbi:hypothetical protein K490DRAFT_58763 [Saccharata proteae CBS 121410]|uniref:Uncharacterized protein n=1 Tax=Saccharata proteae CBS 121410 TaxID=1314787 RepID=A0A9P4HRI7_9PEZI|nr:hypothetical protein K490DRAFT_58763 [Saccharata proteae CBS 121410]